MATVGIRGRAGRTPGQLIFHPMPAHDVLIIGAGLAGQRAALAAASAGATVAIMSKVHPVRSHSNAAAGAIARSIKDGHLEVFDAKTVILASGGAGQCFQPTTNALICTGDGIAQAYRIGAKLMDMEMIQYHPTTLAGNGILITEGARGEGAHLYNAQGERFMEKYAPNKMELASRDVVSRSEQTEINEGRGFPDGTVALDITKVPRKRTLEALREIVNIGRDFAGVDITREPIHIK